MFNEIKKKGQIFFNKVIDKSNKIKNDFFKSSTKEVFLVPEHLVPNLYTLLDNYKESKSLVDRYQVWNYIYKNIDFVTPESHWFIDTSVINLPVIYRYV